MSHQCNVTRTSQNQQEEKPYIILLQIGYPGDQTPSKYSQIHMSDSNRIRKLPWFSKHQPNACNHSTIQLPRRSSALPRQ